MGSEEAVQPKTKGEKIRAALTGKKWSDERKTAFKARIAELQTLYEKTGGKEGAKFGRKAVKTPETPVTA